MNKLAILTPAEKAFLEEAVSSVERREGHKLTRSRRNIILNRAREKIQAQRCTEKNELQDRKKSSIAYFSWVKPNPYRR